LKPGQMLSRERVLEVLRGIEWSGLGIEWAVLYGSLARRGLGRDVDILAHPREGLQGEWVLEVCLRISEALGVDPSAVDLASSSSAPCTIVMEAWRYKVIIYEAREGAAWDWLLTRVEVCYDYELARRKLGIPRASINAVKRRWG